MSVNEEFLDEVLEQLQYGTTMSDNQEPMLTNNRNIAKQAILQHFQQEGFTKGVCPDPLVITKENWEEHYPIFKLYTQSELDQHILEAKEEGARQFKDHLALTDLIMYGESYQEWLEKEWKKNQEFLELSNKEGKDV